MTADKSPGFFLNALGQQWEVSQFTLKNWGISREYALELIVPNADIPSLLNQAAHLTFDDHLFHGFITAHHSVHSDQHQISNIRLVSSLTYYLSHHHTRIYKSESLTCIIRQVLKEAGLQEGIDFALKMNSEKKQWWFNEVNEPGLVFLNRVLAANKLYYAYEQTNDQAQCVFTDSLSALLPDDSLSLQLTSKAGFTMQDGIPKWSSHTRLGPEKTISRSFNAQTAQYQACESLSFCEKKLGQFEILESSHAKTAQARQSLLDEKAHIMTLNAPGMPFKPGQTLDLMANKDSKMVQVCAVEISGFQQQLAGTQRISANPLLHQEAIKTKAFVSSFFSGLPPSAFNNTRLTTRWDTAQIEQQPGLYPDISEKGSYHIRLHQDKDPDNPQDVGNEKNKASWWVRAASYFSGNHYGFNFPLHDGSEVLVAYENGIAQNPVIIGSLTNDLCPSVVSSKNADEHMIATRSGNRLRFVEKNQENLIELSSKDQKNQLIIKEDKEKNILLQSQEGQINLYTSHALSFRSGCQFRQHAQGMLRFWVRGELAVVSELGNITFNVQECINLYSEQNVILTASNHLMQAKAQVNFKSHNSMILKAAKNLTLISNNGRHSWQVPQGNIHIKAEQYIELKAGNSRMLLTSSSLELATSGNLMINAASIAGV